METTTLIIPVDDMKFQTKPMESTVKSRKKQWISYKRHSLKEVNRCLNTCSASLQEQ